MRVLAALLLAGCVSASHANHVPDALRGCWIERRGENTITMRWFPSGGLSWRGDVLRYAPGFEPAAQVFLIEPAAGENEQFGWALCPQEEPTNPPCRPLSFGPAQGGDRAEIHVTDESLRLLLADDPDRMVLFNGQRDGCD